MCARGVKSYLKWVRMAATVLNDPLADAFSKGDQSYLVSYC